MVKHITGHSWKPGVLSKLNTCTRRWIEFCKVMGKPITQFSLNQCLSFLDYCSTTLDLSFYPIRYTKEFLFTVSRFLVRPLSESDRECILKFVKGVFHQKPPIPTRPRMVTWNVDVVLDFLNAWHENEAMSLNDLAGKMALLTLLASMCRIGDVCQMDIKAMTKKEKSLEFRLATPTKTFTENNLGWGGSSLQSLVLQSFHNVKLCPVAAIECYIQRTSGFRGSVGRLFLVVGDQPKSASPQSITRWTKLILSKAGLDKFTVHSGRAAASSCALLLGMPINIILRHAGWRSKHTFARRYMKMPTTTVEDRHGFSKNWGVERGRRIASTTDERIDRFIDKNGTVNAPLCSNLRLGGDKSKLTSVPDKSQCTSKSTRDVVQSCQTPALTPQICTQESTAQARRSTPPTRQSVFKLTSPNSAVASSPRHPKSVQLTALQAGSPRTKEDPQGPPRLAQAHPGNHKLNPPRTRLTEMPPPLKLTPQNQATRNPLRRPKMTSSPRTTNQNPLTISSTGHASTTIRGESDLCAPVTTASVSSSSVSWMPSSITRETTMISSLSKITGSLESAGCIPASPADTTDLTHREPSPQWGCGEFDLIDITVDEEELPILTEADVLGDLGSSSSSVDELIALLQKAKQVPAWHQWKFINYTALEIAHWGPEGWTKQLHEDLVRKQADDPDCLGRPLVNENDKLEAHKSRGSEIPPNDIVSRGKRPHRAQVNILKGSRSRRPSPPGTTF